MLNILIIVSEAILFGFILYLYIQTKKKLQDEKEKNIFAQEKIDYEIIAQNEVQKKVLAETTANIEKNTNEILQLNKELQNLTEIGVRLQEQFSEQCVKESEKFNKAQEQAKAEYLQTLLDSATEYQLVKEQQEKVLRDLELQIEDKVKIQKAITEANLRAEELKNKELNF